MARPWYSHETARTSSYTVETSGRSLLCVTTSKRPVDRTEVNEIEIARCSLIVPGSFGWTSARTASSFKTPSSSDSYPVRGVEKQEVSSAVAYDLP
jgi:hypothetical protein